MNHLFIGGIISFEWVRALCWTLLHSIWQGMLAAVLAGIIILCTKRSKAVIRYNLLCIVYISFIICSVYTFFHQSSFVIDNSSSTPVYRVDRVALSITTDIPETPKHFWGVQKERFLRPVIYYTNKYSSFIAGIWALFFFIHFIKMFVGLRYVHRLRTKQTNVVSREWKERLFTISRMLGIRKLIGLKESALIKVPVVIGFFKPIVLVPLGMFANLSVEQVETILVHELAHVRRRDFVVNLLQRFAESVFFFNPFILWISSRIREEREACCDDIVMEYTSDKKVYVEALVSFRQPDFALHGHAMALAGNNNLLNRVKRMITKENKKLNAMEKLTLILVVLAVTAFTFIPERKHQVIKQSELSQLKTEGATVAAQTKALHEVRPALSTSYITQKDTVPAAKQMRVKSISQNFSDDGREQEVTAISGDGKKYVYKKMNDDIIALFIDGVKIDKQNISRYNSVIELIEHSIADMRPQSPDKLATPLFNLKENQDLLNQKQLALLDHLQGKFDLQNGLAFQKDSLLFQNGADTLLAKKYLQDLLQKENSGALSLSGSMGDGTSLSLTGLGDLKGNLSLLANEDMKLGQINSEINKIINDLAEAGVIGDSTNLSFSLNYDKLIVNGKEQSEALHETFKKKYVAHKKDYYNCNVKGDSRHIDINHE